jgi:hypothetical protein
VDETAKNNFTAVDQFSINDSVMVQNLPEGMKVKLRNGALVEITGNPRDGGWLFVKYLEFDKDPSMVGADEMAFCTDVIEILE